MSSDPTGSAASSRITVGPCPFACFNDTWTTGSGGTTLQWPPPETVTK